MKSCVINDEFTLFPFFPRSWSWSHSSCFQLSAGFRPGPSGWLQWLTQLGFFPQWSQSGFSSSRSGRRPRVTLVVRSRFSLWGDGLSAEGSGFDLSSGTAVILEDNTAGKGRQTCQLVKVFLEKANVLWLFPPLHFLPYFPLQNKLHLSFSDGRWVVCVMAEGECWGKHPLKMGMMFFVLTLILGVDVFVNRISFLFFLSGFQGGPSFQH